MKLKTKDPGWENIREDETMKKLNYRIIKKGSGNNMVPLNIIFVDKRDIMESGLNEDEAIYLIAENVEGPAGINIFDMDAVTTTSDGLVVPGAIVKMAAADNYTINPEFGMLEMEEIIITDELISQEPHLAQCRELYSGKKLFRGPNPDKKLIPVHNVAITGRAANNNSATEMMNVVTMEEILLPILGQLEIMKDKDILIGMTGEHISVGIGMTVAEKYGRVFPTPQFKAGDTAHGSGEYAKTLKKEIPCIVAPKQVLAEHIMDALDVGMVPGKHIGCSPAVLSVAKYYGADIDFDNITDSAWLELNSVDITREWLKEDCEKLSKDMIVKKADNIIPGVGNPKRIPANEFVEMKSISL